VRSISGRVAIKWLLSWLGWTQGRSINSHVFGWTGMRTGDLCRCTYFS